MDMNIKKPTDIPFIVGICVIIIGVLTGIVVGLFTSEDSRINLIPAITIGLLCFVAGTGIISVSGSLSDAKQQKKNDEEVLRIIIDRVKNEDN